MERKKGGKNESANLNNSLEYYNQWRMYDDLKCDVHKYICMYVYSPRCDRNKWPSRASFLYCLCSLKRVSGQLLQTNLNQHIYNMISFHGIEYNSHCKKCGHHYGRSLMNLN